MCLREGFSPLWAVQGLNSPIHVKTECEFLSDGSRQRVWTVQWLPKVTKSCNFIQCQGSFCYHLNALPKWSHQPNNQMLRSHQQAVKAVGKYEHCPETKNRKLLCTVVSISTWLSQSQSLQFKLWQILAILPLKTETIKEGIHPLYWTAHIGPQSSFLKQLGYWLAATLFSQKLQW